MYSETTLVYSVVETRSVSMVDDGLSTWLPFEWDEYWEYIGDSIFDYPPFDAPEWDEDDGWLDDCPPEHQDRWYW